MNRYQYLVTDIWFMVKYAVGIQNDLVPNMFNKEGFIFYFATDLSFIGVKKGSKPWQCTKWAEKPLVQQ